MTAYRYPLSLCFSPSVSASALQVKVPRAALNTFHKAIIHVDWIMRGLIKTHIYDQSVMLLPKGFISLYSSGVNTALDHNFPYHISG